MRSRTREAGSLRKGLRTLLGETQHRNAGFLTANTLLNAAAGLLFWLLLVRVAALSPDQIGRGYAVIALGTTVGVVAKGGLDTALVRHVPQASPRRGAALLRLAAWSGGIVAVLLVAALAGVAHFSSLFPPLSPLAWALVGAIAVLLVVTWLQDAWFIAEHDARSTLQRNLMFSITRLLLPVPLVLLAVPEAVPLTWSLGLLLAAVAASWLARTPEARIGEPVPRRTFIRSALRNVTGGSAEFLPGLLLVPIVLALVGAREAAYFGMAWTGASLLFLVCAAIGRSAMAEIVRGQVPVPIAIGRGGKQMVLLVLPPAFVAVLFAPFFMGIFGADYAREGAATLRILAVSALFVAPAYLYLAVLRARESPFALVAFPAAMVVALFALVPILARTYGLEGAALAWLAANAPFGIFALLRLRSNAQEVNVPAQSKAQRGPSHVE